MLTANQRIPILVTAEEKARIAEMARSAGVSMGEFLRRAAVAYRPAEDETLLEGMMAQVLETTRQAERAIDETLAYVEESNRRIAETVKSQQAKIERLTERVIRLETALEIALSSRQGERIQIERKD